MKEGQNTANVPAMIHLTYNQILLYFIQVNQIINPLESFVKNRCSCNRQAIKACCVGLGERESR